MKRCAKTAPAADLPGKTSPPERSRLCADCAAAHTQAPQGARVERHDFILPSYSGGGSEQGESAARFESFPCHREERARTVRGLAGRVQREKRNPRSVAAAGQLERVQHLVEKDPALAKSYSPDGFPVFALAAVFGHRDAAEYLFAKGADVNAAATNGTGYNALTGAVASGHTSIVAWLLENGADPNYRYAAGYSPLITAAANGHLAIVSMLLGNGADLYAQTNDGKNALSFALERGHAAVAEFLRGSGAA